MKILQKWLFSTRAMTVMLFIYAISLAIATFVENDFGTAAAKEMIYNATWFDILQVLLIINFIANIWRYKLWRFEKWAILLFHFGFIITFIGAGITHIFSVEGMMSIHEGETSNQIVSTQTYVRMNVFNDDMALSYETPYQMTYFNKADASFPFKRQFKNKYQFKDRVITLKSLDYIQLAKDTIIRGEGKNTIELVTFAEGGRKSVFIQDGEMKEVGGVMITMNNPIPGTFQIFAQGNQMYFKSPLEGSLVSMEGQAMGMVTDSAAFNESRKEILIDSLQNFEIKSLYQLGEAQFVLPNLPFKGKLGFIKGDKNVPEEQSNPNVIVMEYNDGTVKDTLILRGAPGNTAYSSRKTINGLQVSMGFGSKNILIPFGIKLRDFQLDTYPGSSNPSSYASEVSVIDNGKEMEHRIYMNNVLDYGGYRFFQSSYNIDAAGNESTVLSINQDRPGTIVTYIGYFMMFVGMFLTLFWKGTRFWDLQKMLKNLKKRNEFILVLMFLIPLNIFAQQDSHQYSDENIHSKEHNQSLEMTPGDSIAQIINFNQEHVNNFEKLLVQDDLGRIKPIGTHALELLRKIYKKDNFHGINATTWFLSLQQNPKLWARTPLIRVNNKIGSETLKKLGVDESGHTSLLNLIDPKTTQYKLQKEYALAFRKKPSEKTQFDKEILNVTERFTIMDNIAKGYYLKIIPVKNDFNESWTSWIKSTKEVEIDTTALGIIGKYFNSLHLAQRTGNWNDSNQMVFNIDDYQQKWGKNVLPPKTKVEIELLYNKVEPFFIIMILYSVLGTILLVLAFIRLFSSSKTLKLIINANLILVAAVFLFHAAGLIVRWYISGVAPWTNGYEAVIFISWVGVLAGFSMYRNGNAFLPAAGAFVAVIMMGFAHGSSLLDPEITPLVPVLKSYWLIIHVAIITSSYGFIGLGMVLSMFSMVLFTLKPSKKIEHNIKEITIVNEMALTVGIFALTIGTFLGGMWANESWGRYWSWDPKETWSFLSVIVYAIVLHLRLVPGLRGKYAFNLASMWAAAAPIMTYFGVNYYLSGLHTYAAGDSIPIPSWVPITVAIFFALSVFAFIKRKQYSKNYKYVKL